MKVLYLLLNSLAIYNSLGRSFLATFSIMVGEYELDDLVSTGHSVLGGRETFLIILLVLSVFFGNIVLMNVFTGLAVGDVALAMSEERETKMNINSFSDYFG